MGFVRTLKGKPAARAAIAAGDIQSDAATDAAGKVGYAGIRAGRQLTDANELANSQLMQGEDRSLGLFANQQVLGQQGFDQSGFLTDPNAQFDFLQNNPLFQMGLDNANQQTNQWAAARGRLSGGDTMQQLNNNALLTASPLIQQQKQSIGDLLNMGANASSNQANIIGNVAGQRAGMAQNFGLNQANAAMNQSNLLTGAAAAQGTGLVGAANARAQGAGNIFNAGAGLAGAAVGAPKGTFV